MRGKASYIDYFIYFLPVECMKDVLLVMTSKNIEGISVSWGKMITYLGLCILMYSVATGGNTRAYWDNSYHSPLKGDTFRLHSFISFAGVGEITTAIFSLITLPNYIYIYFGRFNK